MDAGSNRIRLYSRLAAIALAAIAVAGALALRVPRAEERFGSLTITSYIVDAGPTHRETPPQKPPPERPSQRVTATFLSEPSSDAPPRLLDLQRPRPDRLRPPRAVPPLPGSARRRTTTRPTAPNRTTRIRSSCARLRPALTLQQPPASALPKQSLINWPAIRRGSPAHVMDDPFDPSGLTALVFDENHYERGISLDQLRAMGFGRAIGAAHSRRSLGRAARIAAPHHAGGMDRRRRHARIRAPRPPERRLPNRALSIFMLTARGAQTEVEAARRAGVDGYLRKPISSLALQQRVKTVIARPQPFVVTATYVGPCRRRKRPDLNYLGAASPPRRRSAASRKCPAMKKNSKSKANSRAPASPRLKPPPRR